MRFIARKHRAPPSVIIVSLIDVLIVVLIFMMVATTFKQQPALRLALPESEQTNRIGQGLDHLVVTIDKVEPYLYLGQRPVTFERLQAELKATVGRSAQSSASIRADKGAPIGQMVKVMDACKAAGIKSVGLQIRSAPRP